MTDEKHPLPEWWPGWMSEPDRFPLGHCLECGRQQYSMSSHEDHMETCTRREDPQAPGPTRKVPWPKTYTGIPD